jgi:hypothetical protein|tara:strand:- start:1359 stop:1709 length:351 start_codon:yes stop_codon:yes gene_type:complete
MKNRFLKIPLINSKKGIIGHLEKKIPFKIKRIFFKYDFKESGGHANLKTKMLLICLSGKIQVSIKSNKSKLKKYIMDKPNRALYIKNKEWRKILAKNKKTIILILASEKYSLKDYK